jgi:putative ABC transport system ATP-binding protein
MAYAELMREATRPERPRGAAQRSRMPPANLTLQGRNLTRIFGEGETTTTALRDVSLHLCRGEFVLLMGPSGSGKSTLLAALSGLLRPDCGEVVVLGQDLWQMAPVAQEQFRLRHFGFIFQGYNLFPMLTARQQVEIILRWGEGMPARQARRRAGEILSLLGLSRRLHAYPDQLSGGEKQRVVIGRALVKEPAFCFADEPTSALDWQHGEQVIALLRAAAHERGTTVLAVAHDPRIMPFADRVLHLEDGKLRAS